MLPTLIAETSPEHWKYVSEGGATIVFSYGGGPSNPRFDGTVLRLRKTRIDRVVDAPIPPEGEEDDPTIQFQQKCTKRMIPQEHLPKLESIDVDRTWLDALADLREAERPFERREKDRIDATRCKGILATDLVGGDWIAVEIKVLL